MFNYYSISEFSKFSLCLLDRGDIVFVKRNFLDHCLCVTTKKRTESQKFCPQFPASVIISRYFFLAPTFPVYLLPLPWKHPYFPTSFRFRRIEPFFSHFTFSCCGGCLFHGLLSSFLSRNSPGPNVSVVLSRSFIPFVILMSHAVSRQFGGNFLL